MMTGYRGGVTDTGARGMLPQTESRSVSDCIVFPGLYARRLLARTREFFFGACTVGPGDFLEESNAR